MSVVKLLKKKIKVAIVSIGLLIFSGIVVVFLMKFPNISSRSSEKKVEHVLPAESTEDIHSVEEISSNSNKETTNLNDVTDDSKEVISDKAKASKQKVGKVKISPPNNCDRSVNADKISESSGMGTPLCRKDFSYWNKSCEWNLILLNDANSMPRGMVPKLKDYYGMKVNAGIFNDLDAMIKAARKAGVDLWISSCYRSFEHQDVLHKNKIKFYIDKGNTPEKAKELACRVVAIPGTSEHNQGLAVDFNGVKDNFYLTKEYEWLIEHGLEYGFILRYAANKIEITNKIYEPWHFRYVGEKNARAMKRLGFCLEEYIEYLLNKSPHK